MELPASAVLVNQNDQPLIAEPLRLITQYRQHTATSNKLSQRHFPMLTCALINQQCLHMIRAHIAIRGSRHTGHTTP